MVPTAEMWHESGLVLMQAQRFAESVQAFERSILLNPQYAAAYTHRGNALQSLGANFDAVLNYNAALSLDPNSGEIYNNRGAALAALEDYVGALRSYVRALELKPIFPQCLTNMGNVLKLVGKVSEARDTYKKAIEVDPNYIDAHVNRAFVELELGNFDIGWDEYEWRWKCGQIQPRSFQIPVWNGEDLKDKKILIYGEQGLGDVIQFMRYATIIKEMGAYVILEVRPQLARLAATVPGVDKVVTNGDDLKEHVDFNIALLSIPRYVKMTLETIPNKIPYVSYPDFLSQVWKAKLARFTNLKVGIVWAGSPRPLQPAANAVDKRRSTNLSQWAPLEGLDVTFISLQKEAMAEQAKTPPQGMTVVNWAHELDDLTDTAALVSNLDLVIAVDTAIVHLVGAMGKPVWLLSRHDNCWRWLGHRTDSPWYPTLRQFIQSSPGDWASVFEQVAAELKIFVAQKQLQIAA